MAGESSAWGEGRAQSFGMDHASGPTGGDGAEVVARCAIIGGTGVYDPHLLEDVTSCEIATPYGAVEVQIGTYKGVRVAFMPRHGKGHSIPPHKINYRANIWGLKALGVETILATAAVGSINPEMRPGDFVIVDQFLDFTKGRAATFFDEGDQGVVHIDVTEPYCPYVRGVLVEVGARLGFPLHPRGTYVCVEGPRYETAAEIRAFRILGGDVVGMTSVPEVVLAREAGICYATMAMVTNMGAGMNGRALSHDEVVEIMALNTERVRRLALETFVALSSERLDERSDEGTYGQGAHGQGAQGEEHPKERMKERPKERPCPCAKVSTPLPFLPAGRKR